MPVYTDQLYRIVEVINHPQRIISLVPSQTELLYDLGLDQEIIGITKFCIHPKEWFRNKTRVGGTKTLDLDKIRQLQPDIIIANKEENVKEQIECLAKDFPVWISDVNKLPEALNMIKQIGIITNTYNKALILINRIEYAFRNFKSALNIINKNACYLIWKDPYMSVGGDTFIHDILAYAGFNNILAYQTRYPIVQIKDLETLHCEILLLSSEPYPFKQKHIVELQSQLPTTKILLVNGEAFSWYGSRLLHTPDYLLHLQEEIAAIS